MKRTFAAIFFALSFVSPVSAEEAPETLEGEVAAVTAEQNVLSVTTEPGSAAPDVRVVTDEGTRFVGVDSLDDLRLGDKVEITAVEDERTNTWGAERIRLDERPEEDPALAMAREIIDDETIRSDRSSLARVPPASPLPLENETAPESPAADLPAAEGVPEAASEIPAEDTAPSDSPEEGGPPHRPTGDDQRNFSR